jgi:hypothetical protein
MAAKRARYPGIYRLRTAPPRPSTSPARRPARIAGNARPGGPPSAPAVGCEVRSPATRRGFREQCRCQPAISRNAAGGPREPGQTIRRSQTHLATRTPESTRHRLPGSRSCHVDDASGTCRSSCSAQRWRHPGKPSLARISAGARTLAPTGRWAPSFTRFLTRFRANRRLRVAAGCFGRGDCGAQIICSVPLWVFRLVGGSHQERRSLASRRGPAARWPAPRSRRDRCWPGLPGRRPYAARCG